MRETKMIKTTERGEKLIAAHQRKFKGTNIIYTIDCLRIGWDVRNQTGLSDLMIKTSKIIKRLKMSRDDYNELGKLIECYKYLLSHNVFYRLLEYDNKLESDRKGRFK